jgi:hypothetical protein
METTPTATDRRSFLKTGALIAAPALAAVPAVALADDGSRARLARLEDERAIETLHRELLRSLNGGDSRPGIDLGEGLHAIAADPATDTVIDLAEDGLSAHARHACRIERQTEFTGNSTLERMTRFQGQGSHVHEEHRVLATELVKDKDGWRIARAHLA